MITIKKSDIGGEIISILTKGMYSDPKDALREYIQNGVDAEAGNIDVRIRQNNIVIQDDGKGMDYDTMRKAIRLGISDKNPKSQVGFMGIGIYSAFHICDQLIIYSKVSGNSPNRIKFDFKTMRNELETQREARFKKEIDDDNLIALQKLLENNIEIVNLNNEDFLKIGTRVELIGLESDFFKSLSKFDEIADYLEKVVPLPFHANFKWGKDIQEKIHHFCEKNNSNFKSVNIKLQVNEEIKNLYKPYTDNDFESEALTPFYYELKRKNEVYGIAWGCLNKEKVSIKNGKVRGFLLKKQGFTIGKREDLLEYFGRPIFFNRSIGEIIVTNEKLLPNAARSEFEPSALRASFRDSLKEFAMTYYDYANNYQEEQKANEELDKAIDILKETNAQLEYFADDPEVLLEKLFKLKEIDKDLHRRNKAGRFNKINRSEDFKIVSSQIDSIANQIRSKIDLKRKKRKYKTDSQIAYENQSLPAKTSTTKEKEINSLLDIFNNIGLDLDKDIKKIFQLIDEIYIQPSKSKNEYHSKLKRLQTDIEELFED